MERFICIHGHFYQPPRENPWLEEVEVQDSAYPFHDWNERVTAECYAANGASRILDGAGNIERIVNNYARISFNFGPTLLAWLERHAPDVYDAVLTADRESRDRFGGHGSALAQGYNHIILPLANRRDKRTQVLWGIADFTRRFGREPEGMWLPETAVDVETLEVLAEAGIRFTVLAPHQAARVRRVGGRSWQDVSGGRIDPTTAYAARLPSGRSISVMFYDGPVARAVAFEQLLRSGEDFANRLVGTFFDGRPWTQLVHIATDGETYGHHHRFGDMALAYALELIETRKLARLTNYGEFLERFPPAHEVEIQPATSWSCAHGVERWRSDCGCNTGGHPGWSQAWRGPLRDALDWLRDTLAPLYQARTATLLREPWAARDDYIAVVLDREAGLPDFLARHTSRTLAPAERVEVLKLLEMQRHLMLMYTSCGWFFDELSGIETVQVLQYACRALQLAEELAPAGLEPRFLALLEKAPSNRSELGNGKAVYERLVRPAMVDLKQVGAHAAVSSMFDSLAARSRVHCYDIEREEARSHEAGRLRLAVGRLGVSSRITLERTDLAFAVLHFGDHNLSCGVREYERNACSALAREAGEAFASADIPAVIRVLDRHFSALTYSLKSLFRDEQRRVLDIILAATLTEAEAEYAQLFDNHAALMHFLIGLGAPLPKAFQTAAELILNTRLRRAFSSDALDLERIKALLAQADEFHVPLDTPGLAYALQGSLERLAERLTDRPDDSDALRQLVGATGLARTMPFDVDLWRVQNRYYALRQRLAGAAAPGAEQGKVGADWTIAFDTLGSLLHIRVP